MKTILFFSKAPMNYVMFRPVAEQLMQDARIRFLFHVEFERGQNPNGVYDPLGVRRSQIVPGVTVRWTNYDLYMSADYRVSAKRAKRKVHTFHGISFKGKAYVDHIKNYDDAFLIGPYQKKQFVKRGILAEDDPRFVEVGMPKLDPLVNNTFDRAEVLSRVGADPSQARGALRAHVAARILAESDGRRNLARGRRDAERDAAAQGPRPLPQSRDQRP
jgi:hypothetical protein